MSGLENIKNGHSSYDHIIVAFSGGKDSTACILYLLEQGVPKEKITLWHHDIDGHGGSTLMDWPVTPDYCRCIAEALGLEIRFSWRVGGYARELLRSNSPTAPVAFEAIDGTLRQSGGIVRKRKKACTVCGKMTCAGCRLRFPQVCADLSKRWCTAYLKIDVGARAITGQDEFLGKRTLFVTGERAQESACRAKYSVLEHHRADRRDGRLRRHVDHFRPVHSWSERQVWETIGRWGIVPHPCYYLGWGRCSCAACIFGSKNQWASLHVVNPVQFARVWELEKNFGVTIDRKVSVAEKVARGRPYPASLENKVARSLALSQTYTGETRVPVRAWQLPAGAFGESTGPS